MTENDLIREVLSKQNRLIRLPREGKAVFVGDTHGDFDATENIFRLYWKPGYTLVFLGDYVDRGDSSKENIEFLLKKKLEAPDGLYLLAGNHEGYCKVPFSPADFWEHLSPEDYMFYSEICNLFAFAAITPNGVLGVHGAPPDVQSAEDINTVEMCSEHWFQLTWGDFKEIEGESLGHRGGRPLFGKNYFEHTMNRLGMNVLVRSHQPRIEPVIFDNKCLTLMTSYAYTFDRRIAVVDLEKPEILSVDDLEIIKI